MAVLVAPTRLAKLLEDVDRMREDVRTFAVARDNTDGIRLHPNTQTLTGGLSKYPEEPRTSQFPESRATLILAAMQRLDTSLDGPLLFAPQVFGDERGFFAETYRTSWLAEHGACEPFVQDNHSRSSYGVIRGMHFTIGDGASKLVRCGRGRILDVLVDVRPGSPQYGQWEAYELSDANMHVLYVPVGFAHGFCVLSEVADVLYKQSAYYSVEVERGFAVDDPDVAIKWPVPEVEQAVSERDRSAPSLAQVADGLPFEYRA